MPKKDFLQTLPTRKAGQDDNAYLSETRSYIKSQRPDLDDEIIEDISLDHIASSPAPKVRSERVAGNLNELKKTYKAPLPKNTVEAFKSVVPQVPVPVMEDPIAAAGRATNPVLDAMLATGRRIDQPQPAQRAPAAPILPPQVADQTSIAPIVPLNANQQAQEMETIAQINQDIAQRQQDPFQQEAAQQLPNATPEQQKAFADVNRTNSEKQAAYQAQTVGGNLTNMPDDEFYKAIKKDDLAKDVQVGGITPKLDLGGRYIDFINSPEFKGEVLRTSGGDPFLLPKVAREIAESYRKNPDNWGSSLGKGVQNVADALYDSGNAGKAIYAGLQYPFGFARGLEGVGNAGGSLIQSGYDFVKHGWDITNKPSNYFTNLRRANENRVVPSFKAKNESGLTKVAADAIGMVGDIKGAMGLFSNAPKVAEGLRKTIGYGTTDATAIAALESGKTAQSALGVLGKAIRSQPAKTAAKILDDAAVVHAAFGLPSVPDLQQEYIDQGFSEEQAFEKANKKSLLQSLAFASTGFLPGKEAKKIDQLFGRGSTPLKSAIKHGLMVPAEMTAIRAATDGSDKMFDGGWEQLATDALFGAMTGARNGTTGRRNVSRSQRGVIAELLSKPEAMGEMTKNASPKEQAEATAFINTLQPYYKEAIEQRGYAPEQAAMDAMERATMVQSARRLESMDAERDANTRFVPSVDQATGEEIMKPQYKVGDKWSDKPSADFTKEYRRLSDEYRDARKSLVDIENGVYAREGQIMGADKMQEIAQAHSPEGRLRPEQVEPLELSSPYEIGRVDISKYAEDPEIVKLIEQYGAEQMLGDDAFIDVNPIIDREGNIIDGKKAIAAALYRGDTDMFAYKSMPVEKVKEQANEIASEMDEDAPDYSKLTDINKTALKEMREVYERHLEENQEDVAGAVESVVKDGLERGYGKEDVVNMAQRVNSGALPEPIIEAFYNDAIKEGVQVKEQTTEPSTQTEQTRDVVDKITEPAPSELEVKPETPSDTVESSQISEQAEPKNEESKPTVEPKGQSKVKPDQPSIEAEPNQVEKQILKKRVYDGEFRKGVKEELEKFGLTREVESRTEASQKARKLIDEVGADAAVDAVKSKDVQGAAATYVLDAVASELSRQIRKETNPEEIAKLEKRQAEIINDLEEMSTEAGRQVGALADVFATSDLKYNLAKRIEDYKKNNNGEIPKEVEEKLRRLDRELFEVSEKLKEAESRHKEEVRKLKEKEPRVYKERAKRIADQFRKLKSKPLVITAADGTPLEIQKNAIPGIDELIELGAKAIEKTGEIADGIKAIKDRLVAERWFSSLSQEDKDAVTAQIETHFNIEEDIRNDKLLNIKKKRLLTSIADYAQRLRDQNFEKKTRKIGIEDSEVIKLRAEKQRIKDEFDKEQYKAELKNRTPAEKFRDILKEAWGITRSLRATGELSFVGIQGLAYTVSHPKLALKAAQNAAKFMAKESNATEWLNQVKSQDWYDVAKKTKLAITEPSAKDSAREESFVGNWTNLLWDKIIGAPTLAMSKSAQEAWRKKNPFKALERGAVGYLDTIRIERFLDGMELLKAQGKNPQDNAKDYKDVADLINTLTGRASLGKLEPVASTLSNVFFSPRMWAAQVKTSSPYALYYFAKLSPTARKMALRDYGTFVGATAGMVAMVAAALANDDDPDTGVEFDPRSSDFGKIKLGKIRIDPWGGHIQDVVLTSKFIMNEKKDKKGKIVEFGSTPFSGDRFDLVVDRTANKLSPTAAIAYRYMTQKEKGGKPVDKFGKPYSLGGDVAGNLYPIYWDTIAELAKDKESSAALDGFLTTYALFGGGVNVYDK